MWFNGTGFINGLESLNSILGLRHFQSGKPYMRFLQTTYTCFFSRYIMTRKHLPFRRLKHLPIVLMSFRVCLTSRSKQLIARIEHTTVIKSAYNVIRENGFLCSDVFKTFLKFCSFCEVLKAHPSTFSFLEAPRKEFGTQTSTQTLLRFISSFFRCMCECLIGLKCLRPVFNCPLV